MKKMYKVVNTKTNKTVVNGFDSKAGAKDARNALNKEAGYENNDSGKAIPFKVSKDVEHPKF